MIWQTTRFRLELDPPLVMGVVNVTPDSFFDGGAFFKGGSVESSALSHCEKLLRQGANILDIGGESSRPGAVALPLDEELARVLPVVRGALGFGVPISVDSYKPQVMRAVLELGADIINDIWALRQPGALNCFAAFPTAGVCLMHMHGEPQTMQAKPMNESETDDVVALVRAFLRQRVEAVRQQGIAAERVVLDPGIGFGKTPEQNFKLLARQRELLDLGLPLLAAWSRKSSLGHATGLPVQERMVPSVAAALLALERGARILRVHDVAETVQALQVWRAMSAAN